jgi:hypothetical protein
MQVLTHVSQTYLQYILSGTGILSNGQNHCTQFLPNFQHILELSIKSPSVSPPLSPVSVVSAK